MTANDNSRTQGAILDFDSFLLFFFFFSPRLRSSLRKALLSGLICLGWRRRESGWGFGFFFYRRRRPATRVTVIDVVFSFFCCRLRENKKNVDRFVLIPTARYTSRRLGTHFVVYRSVRSWFIDDFLSAAGGEPNSGTVQRFGFVFQRTWLTFDAGILHRLRRSILASSDLFIRMSDELFRIEQLVLLRVCFKYNERKLPVKLRKSSCV